MLEIHDLAQAYLDGSLSAADKVELERRLATSDADRRAFLTQLRLDGELRLALRRAPATTAIVPGPGHHRFGIAAGLTAAAAAVVLALLPILQGRPTPPASGAQPEVAAVRPQPVVRQVILQIEGGNPQLATVLSPSQDAQIASRPDLHSFANLDAHRDHSIGFLQVIRDDTQR